MRWAQQGAITRVNPRAKNIFELRKIKDLWVIGSNHFNEFLPMFRYEDEAIAKDQLRLIKMQTPSMA